MSCIPRRQKFQTHIHTHSLPYIHVHSTYIIYIYNVQAYYFHLPSTILECEVDNPHLSPVYTPPSGDKYCLWKRHDSHTMGDTEWVLHHNTVFLVLDETDPNTPVINCVQEVSEGSE